MTSPRHLWSGDWRSDSAEVSQKLARRRAAPTEPPAEPQARAPRGPSRFARAAAWFRGRSGASTERPVEARPTATPPSAPASERPTQRLFTPPARTQPTEPRMTSPAPVREQPTEPRMTSPAPVREQPAEPRIVPPPPAREHQPDPAIAPPAPVRAFDDRSPGLGPAPARPAPLRIAEPVRVASSSLRAGRSKYARAFAVIALTGLVVAGAAYGLSAVVHSRTNSSTAASSPGPWLGIEMTNSPFTPGVLVTQVAPGSPASRAGLMPGDVITLFDNQPVGSAAQVTAAMQQLHVGDEVTIGVNRGGASYFTQAILSNRSSSSP
jgi:hypothetical protein